MAKPRKKRSKITGGSGALQAQSLQRTLTWTNPLKFMQNVRYKSFLGDDDREAADGPHHHSALHKKISHHLDKIQRWKGKRSLEHVLPDESLHKKVHHHLNKIEERTGKRSISHMFPQEAPTGEPAPKPAAEAAELLLKKKKKSVFDGLFG